MIMHVAPRRVTLVNKDEPRSNTSIDLSTVLGVDLVADAARRVNLVVRLTNGAQVIACSYTRMSEAGPDCGRLRVLAGLPAWTGCSDMAGMEAQSSCHRSMTVVSTMISAAMSLARATMSPREHDRHACHAGWSIFNRPRSGQSEGVVAKRMPP
jgi:hypothetical protein